MICLAKCRSYLRSSCPPSAVYMRQWIWSALVQIMARRIFGAKPVLAYCCIFVAKLIPGYCLLDPKEQNAVKFQSQNKIFSLTKMHLRNGGHLPQGRWVKTAQIVEHIKQMQQLTTSKDYVAILLESLPARMNYWHTTHDSTNILYYSDALATTVYILILSSVNYRNIRIQWFFMFVCLTNGLFV